MLINAVLLCYCHGVYQAAQGGQKMLPTLEVMLDDKIAALAARQAEDEVTALIIIHINSSATLLNHARCYCYCCSACTTILTLC
jgi:hypothetical protein